MPGVLVKLVLFLLLFLLYLTTMFVVLRLSELAEWYKSGIVASQVTDPKSLSVSQLKNLLDTRGVNYESLVEKKELSQLVKQSGNVYGGELIMAEESESDDTLFKSGEHFREEVESRTDSVWLIKVIPPGRRGLLPPDSWKTVKRKVSYFGIRTGIFNCTLDSSFCLEKKWIKPSILLAMEIFKDYVTMFHHYKPSQPAYILDWINIHLESKITILSNHGAARKWMESAERFSKYIHVAYYSKIDQLPLFYSALAVKFTGRIKFAFISTMERSQNDTLKVPSILVIMPEGTLLYGKCPGEPVSYAGLGLYLSTLSFDLTYNNASYWSLVLVNIICVSEFFITQGGFLTRFICTVILMLISSVRLSVVVLLLLLLVMLLEMFLSILIPVWYFADNLLYLGTFLSLIELFTNFTDNIHHKFLTSNIMCYIRNDVLVYCHNTKFLLLTYLTYWCIIALIQYYRKRTTVVPQEPNAAARPHPIVEDPIVEGAVPERARGLQLRLNQMIDRINRLVLDDKDRAIDEAKVSFLLLWLQTDYTSLLPTWKYCSRNVRDCHRSLGVLCGPCEQMNDEPNEDEINEYQPNVTQQQHEFFNRFLSPPCGICYEKYYHGQVICGLPCGHSFHHENCILKNMREYENHRCPNCRLPAYSHVLREKLNRN